MLKRVVLVLELLDDEADLVIAAASQTSVRFGGLPLDEIVEINRQQLPSNVTDGTEVSHFSSEGVMYQGHKPLKWSFA